MRIALLGEGTYPVVTGGVSTWTDHLFRGLPEHEFHVVTLVAGAVTPVWQPPPNVASVTLHPFWGTPQPSAVRGTRRSQHLRRRRLSAALDQLWSTVFPTGERTITSLADPLQELSQLAQEGSLSELLLENGSAAHLLRAWRLHARAHGLGEIAPSDAALAGRLADSMLRALDVSFPEVDVLHSAANGPASLMGLGRHWTDGTPLVLTEHGVYLRERFLALDSGGFTPMARKTFLSLLEGVCRLAYAEAHVVAPVSDFNGRWARRLGADPDRIITIHNGIGTDAYPELTREPAVPTVSFVGRIDPLKDLATLIRAFRTVDDALPEARLRLFGPTPAGNEDYQSSLEALIIELGLTETVRFEGAVSSSRIASEAGHVVALSSISEGLPFSVMEAMMCGRATVNTDVGGVAEVAGRDGTAGVVVPPRDHEAMGRALTELLLDDERRRAVGRAARQRALDMFTMERFLDRHRMLYASCVLSNLSLLRPSPTNLLSVVPGPEVAAPSSPTSPAALDEAPTTVAPESRIAVSSVARIRKPFRSRDERAAS